MRSGFNSRSASRVAAALKFSGCRTWMPRPSASRLTADGARPRPRPAGRSGWVYTATTSLCLAAARRLGTANSGVSANTMRRLIAASPRATNAAARSRRVEPALLGQLLAHHLALERREVIHEQLAQQVIHLVLHAHREQTVGMEFERLAAP